MTLPATEANAPEKNPAAKSPPCAALRAPWVTPWAHGPGQFRKDPFGKALEDTVDSLGNACRKHPYFFFNLHRWHPSFLYAQTFHTDTTIYL